MKKSNKREPVRSKTRKKSIKGRINLDPAKLPTWAKIVLLICLIVLLVLCFINLGLIFTLFTAFMVGVIIGIAKLLDSAQKSRKKRRVINILLILFLTLGILALIFFAAFLVYVTVNAPKFDVTELNKKESTIIYDKDGNQIIKLGAEMRDKVKYDELPEVLVDAIIATEDSRYYQHNGIDMARFIKASFGQVLGHSDAGGASTLSMQVIKNTFTSSDASGIHGIIRKFTDIYLAVFKLEKTYNKQEIIEFYVNNHFLGGNIYGVQEASLAYFGKDVGDLNLSEAAILAGMFKSPNAFRPNVNPKNATNRRNTVLYLMKKHGYITKEEYDMAKSIPVESLTADVSQVTTSPYQGYIDTVVEEISDTYGVNAYTTPLLIYTNMDRDRQNGVNDVLDGKTYNWIDDKVQTGVAVLETQTGKILAIGNGRNKDGAGVNSFNYATQGKRQPGSTAKPLFDYGPGIEYNDWSTYTLFDDAPYTYSGGRSIKNWDGGYYGTITMRRALSTSRNIPALKAFQQVDNNKISEFVTGLGLTPEICESGYEYDRDNNICVNPKDKNDKKDTVRLHEAHSIGAFTGTNPLEMSAAYAAFSNGGTYHEPYSVSKIVYRDTGKTEEHKDKSKQVMSDATAFMISSILQDVNLTGGTPKNLACKTGTTNFDENTMNNYGMPWDAIRDSWVIGYTTKTVIGMWYGYDSFTRESIADGYVLHNIPASAQKDRLFLALARGAMESNKEEFKMPDSVVKLGIVSGSNPAALAPEGYSGGVTYEYFKKGKEPELATATKLDTPSGLKVTYSGDKVTITWKGVSKLAKDENYGAFGYNVYQGSRLLTFTSGTSYTFKSTSPYDTYKVIATYKSYSGAQSDPATYQLKETAVEEVTKLDCGTLSLKVGDAVPTTSCKFTVNNSAVSGAVISIASSSSDCHSNGKFTAAKNGCTITYNIKYNNKTYEANVNYTITDDSKEDDTTPTTPTTNQ